ncbi:MAG TPA: carbamoyltransferase [Gemmatimonadaceae bacterium]|nr:carbamoyltransferase [Gemmatimonadaceae bacterium]
MPAPAPACILGISAFYHDSAACLLRDGEIVAAASEERFTRIKGDASFPAQAAAYCLEEAGIGVDDLAAVAFYDKPLLKFERILETYLSIAPRGFRSFLLAGPVWMKDKLYQQRMIREALDYRGELLYAEHHESHAASAFYPSPFQDAAILTIDGVGEWATAAIGVGNGADVRILHELRWPDSLGLLYSAFTYFTGFKVNSGEYKVMGLAPYGAPKYVDVIYRELIELREDGSFRLNQRYFDYLGGLTMTSPAFDELFGGPPRVPESPLTQREMDLARSVQEVCEEVMLRMARTARRQTGLDALCLAGGVALNCVGNGRLLRESGFHDLWIQPAAGDAGGALGAAQLAWHRHFDRPRHVAPGGRDAMRGAALGPSFAPDDIARQLDDAGAVYCRLDHDTLMHRTAESLADGQVIGWFDGRMEFGPRALGHRSILGDPRNPRMQAEINLRIKFREGFRPFAPSVLRERVGDWFELDRDSPYMLLVAPVRRDRQVSMTDDQRRLWGIDKLNVVRSDIPAVTHVDYSARIQTVDRETSPRFHELISRFEQMTGCAVLVNTSFNVRGEPIVCTPADAYRCFMQTGLDALVLYPYLLLKQDQPRASEAPEWNVNRSLD